MGKYPRVRTHQKESSCISVESNPSFPRPAPPPSRLKVQQGLRSSWTQSQCLERPFRLPSPSGSVSPRPPPAIAWGPNAHRHPPQQAGATRPGNKAQGPGLIVESMTPDALSASLETAFPFSTQMVPTKGLFLTGRVPSPVASLSEVDEGRHTRH